MLMARNLLYTALTRARRLVVLVGRDGNLEITMEEIGERAGSFHYEFVCGISRRVPRIYFQKGRQQEQVHYLLVNG